MMANPKRANAAGEPTEIGSDLTRRGFLGRSAAGAGVALGQRSLPRRRPPARKTTLKAVFIMVT